LNPDTSLRAQRRGKPRALIFHATSVPSGHQRVLADTVRARLGYDDSWVPAWLRSDRRVRYLLGNQYRTLSYIVDWREAWEASPDLDPVLVDVNDALAMARAPRQVRDADLVVVLHSAAGDNLGRIRRLETALQRRRAPLLLFFGNEYMGMTEKIGFARSVGAEFIGSQLQLESARWLYAEGEATVVAIPQALNPRIYRQLGRPRDADIGFRGDFYDHAYALGDAERISILREVEALGPEIGLTIDIEYGRVEREAWNKLLNGWLGIAGAESGTYFLERDDDTRNRVIEFLRLQPKTEWAEVYARFFEGRPVEHSGKAISSRHFEALGTETVQVLVEGCYNGILEPDLHYLAVRRDLGNLEEVLRRFSDQTLRREIARRGRELALSAHTYTHRVRSAVEAVLGS
jgi:Glycosyl transferases group 1